MFCFVLFNRESFNNTGWPLSSGERDKERAGWPEGWSNGPSSEGAAAEAAVTMYGMGRPPRSVSSPWPLAPRRDGSGVGLGDRMRGRAAAFPQAVTVENVFKRCQWRLSYSDEIDMEWCV